MRYFKTKYGTIINENNEVIPMQEGNSLYNEYLEFLANEGTIEETDFLTEIDLEIQSKELVPFEVPLWTMRNVMRKANIFDLIIGVINQLDEPLKTDALDYLEYGNYIERHSNTVLLIQQITQFTDAQVDTLFIDANNLKL
jgi:hypothetical protein